MVWIDERNNSLYDTINFMKNNDAMIIAQEVTKIYRTGKVEVSALKAIDLEVQKGEMVAVMGPSGCGKTTLLNCLSGLDNFDQGEVYIEGTALRAMGDRKRTTYRAQRMGFVFQTFNLLPVRVTIARALVNQPAIIWADEPTGNLDSKTAADILTMMQRLNQEHEQTFVIVTHDTEVVAMCNRVVQMSDGEIVN